MDTLHNTLCLLLRFGADTKNEVISRQREDAGSGCGRRKTKRRTTAFEVITNDSVDTIGASRECERVSEVLRTMRSTSGDEPKTKTRTDGSLMTLLREHSGHQATEKATRPRTASHAGRRRGSDVFVDDAVAVTATAPSRRPQRPKSANSSRLRRAKKSSTDSGCCDADDDDEDELIYVDEDYKSRSSGSSVEHTGIGGLSLASTAWEDAGTDIRDNDIAKPGDKRTTLSTLDAEPRRRVFSDSDVISAAPPTGRDVMGRLAPKIAAERVLERYRRRTSLDATGNGSCVAPAHNPHKPTSRAPESGHQLPRKLRPILLRTRQSSLGDDVIGRGDVIRNTSGLCKTGQGQLAVNPVAPRGECTQRPAGDSTTRMTKDFGRSRAWKSLQPLESHRPSNPLPQTPQ